MEFILEFILTLILEGGTTVGKNRKYSRWIRYPLLLLVGIVYVGIIALFVLVGFLVLGDGLWRAIVMWVFALAFIIWTIWDFRDRYKKKRKLQ